MAATTGPLADFGRLPTNRKVGLFAVVGLLAGALYYQFGYKALAEKVNDADQEHGGKVQKNKTLGDDIPKFEELKTHIAKLRRDIEKNQSALPSEAEVPAFFETLERKVTESGVEIANWKKQNEQPVESFVKVPVDIEISGTFMQIKRFFASLVPKERATEAPAPGDERGESHERIVSIENLAIAQPVVRNREIILTAKFTAVTFRQEDKPVGAAAAPGAAPKPAAPPPPSAPVQPAPSAPMPSAPANALPPANTPAGAKARVEESLQKTEQRGADPAGSGSARLKGGL